MLGFNAQNFASIEDHCVITSTFQMLNVEKTQSYK